MNISTSALAKAAILGGFVVAGAGHAFRYCIQYMVRTSDHYKEAITALHDSPVALRLLGESIVDGNIDVGNLIENGSEGTTSWFTVPVKGTNASGKLYYVLRYYEKPGDVFENKKSEKCFKVSKIALLLDKDPENALVIRDANDDM